MKNIPYKYILSNKLIIDLFRLYSERNSKEGALVKLNKDVKEDENNGFRCNFLAVNNILRKRVIFQDIYISFTHSRTSFLNDTKSYSRTDTHTFELTKKHSLITPLTDSFLLILFSPYLRSIQQ